MMQYLPLKTRTLINDLLESSATFKERTAEKAAFIFLGLADLVLTVIAANLGLNEINSFVRLIMELPALLLVVKLLIPILVAWLMPGKFLIPSIALLSFVVIWDVRELAVLFL